MNPNDLPNNAAQELPAVTSASRQEASGSVQAVQSEGDELPGNASVQPARPVRDSAQYPAAASPRRTRHRCHNCGKRIEVDHITPPIPTTDYDWRATFDNYDGAPDSHCPIGYGPTERAAVDDLLDQHAEDCEPSPEHVARTIAENADDQLGTYGR